MLKIITDSSSNITQEEAAKLGITVVPLTLSFGTQEYRDGVDIRPEEFYQKLVGGKDLPHTSQLAETQIEEAVKEALQTADRVLLMPLAAALSGSYERCKAVAEKYENVTVYETKCTTVMLKAMVLEALKNADRPIGEIVAALDALRPRLRIYAALDTLEYLAKGGRLSKTSALLGSLLKIKPVITFTQDGKVELVSKQFGMNKGIGYILSKVDPKKVDFTRPVYLIYTMNDKNAEILRAKLGVEFSEKSNICPVIGTHIGPYAVGVVYAEK